MAFDNGSHSHDAEDYTTFTPAVDAGGVTRRTTPAEDTEAMAKIIYLKGRAGRRRNYWIALWIGLILLAVVLVDLLVVNHLAASLFGTGAAVVANFFGAPPMDTETLKRRKTNLMRARIGYALAWIASLAFIVGGLIFVFNLIYGAFSVGR